MKDAITSSTVNEKSYDDVPYTSYPFAQTDPQLARSIAYLFGLNAPNPSTARILEIGCASGNNILAIAARFPKAKCTGFDLSAVQIEEGQKNIKALGVKNLKLEKKSLLDVNKSYGEFDYIICHGVFSWVSADLQAKILKICSENLSKDGIAYISYNTMPGWSTVKAIREMMLYHTARFPDPKIKAEQSRLLLKFISDTLKNYAKNPYGEIIESELQLLQKQSDFYLLHEHLEENNIQYYFHQFMEMANKDGLQYLGDAALTTMFAGNLPKDTAEVLATADDIIRSEQYMDFINNRRFRMTLLCHKDRILRRNLMPDQIVDKFFTSNFAMPENLKGYKYDSGDKITFKSPQNMEITTNDPLLVAAAETLAANKNAPLHMSKIAKAVIAKLKSEKLNVDATEEQVANSLAASFLRAIFMGGLTMHLEEAVYTTKVSAKPKVFALARHQAPLYDWVTNMRQENTKTGAFDKAVMPLMDGTNDIAAIATLLLPKFLSDELQMSEGSKKITDKKVIEKNLPGHLKSLLNRYAELALLEA